MRQAWLALLGGCLGFFIAMVEPLGGGKEKYADLKENAVCPQPEHMCKEEYICCKVPGVTSSYCRTKSKCTALSGERKVEGVPKKKAGKDEKPEEPKTQGKPEKTADLIRGDKCNVAGHKCNLGLICCQPAGGKAAACQDEAVTPCNNGGKIIQE